MYTPTHPHTDTRTASVAWPSASAVVEYVHKRRAALRAPVTVGETLVMQPATFIAFIRYVCVKGVYGV